MAEQKLIMNILNFNHPVENKEFAFYTEKKANSFPLHNSEWPEAIGKILPNLDENTQFLYVDALPEWDDDVLSINLPESPKIAKHYYNWLIYNYFSSTNKCLAKPNFIGDNEFWFWEKDLSEKDEFHIFKRFILKVQLNRITDFPELVISYEGISKVFKKGLDNLNIPIELIKKVIYNHQIISYKHLPDEAKQNISKVRPVLNNQMYAHLNLEWIPDRNPNKLKSYYNEISRLVLSYLNKPDFTKIIPLKSSDFIQITDISVFKTANDSSKLIFGKNNGIHATGLKPYFGLKENGPYQPSPLNNIELIYIFHEKDLDTVKDLQIWFDGNENRKHCLKKFIKINFYHDINKSIIFKDIENPMPEIRQQLEKWPRISGTTYLGIYITPYPKETTDPEIHSLYYKVKYELLKYKITSQVIETETINNINFRFSLPNIAIAILAKLQGIPWRLHRTIYNELIVGVGAFKFLNMATRYIGSAFCFSNNGDFQNFNCYSAHNTLLLAGSIREAVVNFAEKNKTVERLVIHFYKRMKKKDLTPIINVLRSLNLNIPVIIITINKTESRDLVVFDKNCPSENMIPNSGTIVNIGKNQYLLCNNSRYEDEMPDPKDGFPFPIKLSFYSTDYHLLESTRIIKDLIDQVYQFSRMYWTSVTQQNLPVTVKYPEMVAEKYPHFESTNLPDFGKENLWFL